MVKTFRIRFISMAQRVTTAKLIERLYRCMRPTWLVQPRQNTIFLNWQVLTSDTLLWLLTRLVLKILFY